MAVPMSNPIVKVLAGSLAFFAFFHSMAYWSDAGTQASQGFKALSSNLNTVTHGSSRPTPREGSTVVVNKFVMPAVPDSSVAEILQDRIVVKKHLTNKVSIMSPLERCSPTSQVRIQQYSDDHWMLTSLDSAGRTKAAGGDEYYVTFTANNNASSSSEHKVTLVAFAQDYNDGSYGLHFSTTPLNSTIIIPSSSSSVSGVGDVTVHLQYTCGIGAMGQPLKDAYNGGAHVGVQWTHQNVSMPSYATFIAPTSNTIDFSRYKVVVGFGDSIMQGLFHDQLQEGREQGLYRPHTTRLGKDPKMELHNETVTKLIRRLKMTMGHTLRRPNNVALVVGSASWDLLSPSTVDPDFARHLVGVRKYITKLQTKYPHVDLYWRSATAFHPEQFENGKCGRTCQESRYMSNSRSRDFYEKQNQVVREMGIPILDLWDATYLSGDHMLRDNDGQRYSTELNKLMQSWFYRNGGGNESQADGNGLIHVP